MRDILKKITVVLVAVAMMALPGMAGAETGDTSQSTVVDSIQNGSFEEGQTWTGNYQQPDQANVPAWNTTAFQGKIELFRQNKGIYVGGVTLTPTDGSYAAELNADEESTLYQNVRTEPSSLYEWGLDHGARSASDTMALIIGPKQAVDPSKASKESRDQFMQMIDWLLGQNVLKQEWLDSDGYFRPGIYDDGEPIILYSKPFAEKGAFRDNADNKAFSLKHSAIYTEKWYIWLMTSECAKKAGQENPWSSFGDNAEKDTSAQEENGQQEGFSKYYHYPVPAGQEETVFAFVSVKSKSKSKTLGNFLDHINFKLYRQFSGSSSLHGKAIISADSDGGGQGSGGTAGHEVTSDNNVVIYVPDKEDLNIQAIIHSGDIGDVAFAGVYYTRTDENGQLITEFITRDQLKEDGKPRWTEKLEDSGDITYTTTITVTSGFDLHFVFVKSPLITYDANGGDEYVCSNNEETKEEADRKPSVYSFKPVEGSTEPVFIKPYKSHAAVKTKKSSSGTGTETDDAWKFMGWLLYDDYGLVKEGNDPLLLPGVHRVACNYTIRSSASATPGEATSSGASDTITHQEFVVVDGDYGFEKEGERKYDAEIPPKVVGVEWGITGSEPKTPKYRKSVTGLTFLAQWRWKQTFVPQTKNGAKYQPSTEGGTITVNAEAVSDTENYEASLNGTQTYFAELRERITLEAKVNPGFYFEGWYDSDGKPVSNNEKLTYEVGNGEVKTYYARFAGTIRQQFIRQIQTGPNTFEDLDRDNEKQVPKLQPDEYTVSAGTEISCTAGDGEDYGVEGWYAKNGNEYVKIVNGEGGKTLLNDGHTIRYEVTEEATYYVRYVPKETVRFVPRFVTIRNGSEQITADPPVAGESYGSVSPASAKEIPGKKVSSTATAGAGYAFVGWYDSDTAKRNEKSKNAVYSPEVTSGGATYYALFKGADSSYQVQHIKLKENGEVYGTPETRTVEDGVISGAQVEEAPKTQAEYPGYQFKESWEGKTSNTSGIVRADGTLVLTLYYAPNTDTKYTVEHYKVSTDGQTATLAETETQLKGTTDTLATAQSKTYDGYAYAPNFNQNGMKTVESGTISGDGTLVLKLYYVPNAVVLRYDPGDGIGNAKTYNVHVDQTVQTITEQASGFTRQGYSFAGWNTQRDGKGQSYGENKDYVITQDNPNTLYAQWSPRNDTQFTVEHVLLDSSGGKKPSPERDTPKGTTGNKVDYKPYLKTLTGYTFVENHKDNVLEGIIRADGSLKLVLHYAPNPITLTYKANGGVGDDKVRNAHVDDQVEVMINPFTYANHSFTGWNTRPDGSGTGYQPVDPYLMKAGVTHVLYAQWQEDSKTTLTYDANGGTGIMAVREGHVGTQVPVEDNQFSRLGYTFTGWNTRPDGSGTAYAAGSAYTLTAGTDILYAQWTPVLPVVPPEDADLPKTGDGSHLTLWLLLLAVSSAMTASALRGKGRRGARH